MLKAVFLDMDDTLIVNQILYDRAHVKLFDYLLDFGISVKESEEAFAKTDTELFKTYGRSRKRLPTTFETVLKHFIPAADAEMVKTVRGFAEEVFDTVADVKPGAAAAVELLSQHYPVYIVTAGEKDVQDKRLAALPFKDKITGSYVVDTKDRQVFEDVLAKVGLKPEDVVMIGDSLKSDIIPAIATGMEAIWVEAQNSPLHETAKGLPAKAQQFPSLLEAAEHLVKYGTAAPQSKAAAPQSKTSAPKNNGPKLS